jgi:hypothetical protein
VAAVDTPRPVHRLRVKAAEREPLQGPPDQGPS